MVLDMQNRHGKKNMFQKSKVHVLESNRILGTFDTPTIAGNNLTWTQIGSTLVFATSTRTLALFGANASGATSGITTVTFANTQLGCTVSFFHATGVDLASGVAAAFVQNVSNSGTGTAGSVTLAAASATKNRAISGWCHLANEVTTHATNWTEADDLAGIGHMRGSQTQYRTDAFDTAAAATWTTSSAWGGIAAELKAA